MKTNLNELALLVHSDMRKFWFNPDGTSKPRNKGELMMHMVRELSEMFEAERHDLMDDKLPHRRGVEVEAVDLIMRVLDYAGKYKLDLDGAFKEKRTVNQMREDHKIEALRENPFEK